MPTTRACSVRGAERSNRGVRRTAFVRCVPRATGWTWRRTAKRLRGPQGGLPCAHARPLHRGTTDRGVTMHHRFTRWLGQCTVVSCILAALSDSATAQLFQKTITYTRFFGFVENVKQAVFNYDMGTSTTFFSNHLAITTTPGADGVLFAPDGDLIVGGQADAVHKVVIAGGTFTTVTAGGIESFHVMLDPSGQKVWTASIPGWVADVPLNPFSNGTAHQIFGDDNVVTHLAFVGNQVFYTSSQPSGLGNFGTIDLT